MPGAFLDLSTSPSLSITKRQKHDSFNMSGSVFLITSDGKTVSLPIPSQSPCDPLNWTWQKRAAALISVGIFAYSGLIATQGASVVSSGLAKEFPYEVRYQGVHFFGSHPCHCIPVLTCFLGKLSLHHRDTCHCTYTVHGHRGVLMGTVDVRTWTKTSVCNCVPLDAYCVSGCILFKNILPTSGLRLPTRTSRRVCTQCSRSSTAFGTSPDADFIRLFSSSSISPSFTSGVVLSQ